MGNTQVDSTSITFSPDATASNGWSTPQTVQVKGQSDAVADGNINYSIITTVSSLDPNYAAIDPPNVGLTNNDKGFGITISPTFLLAYEGQTTSITTVLNQQPTSDVRFPLVVTVGAGTFNLTARKWYSLQQTGTCHKPLWCRHQ